MNTTKVIFNTLACFEYATCRFEKEAVAEAQRHRTEITPYLLDILEDAVKDSDYLASTCDYTAHLYAIYLLTQFREVRAHIPLLQLCLLSPRKLNAILGDFQDIELEQALAATCGGGVSGILLLAADPAVGEFVREAAIRAMVKAAATGAASREAVVDALRELFLRLERKPSGLWDELVAAAGDMTARELGGLVLCACEEDLTSHDWDLLKDALGGEWELSRFVLQYFASPQRDPDSDGWWCPWTRF
jgi:hypothetical protein